MNQHGPRNAEDTLRSTLFLLHPFMWEKIRPGRVLPTFLRPYLHCPILQLNGWTYCGCSRGHLNHISFLLHLLLAVTRRYSARGRPEWDRCPENAQCPNLDSLGSWTWRPVDLRMSMES